MRLSRLHLFLIFIETLILAHIVSLISIESSIPWIKSTRNSLQRLALILASFTLYLIYKYAKEQNRGTLRSRGLVLLASTAIFNISFLVSAADSFVVTPGRFWLTSMIHINFSMVVLLAMAATLSGFILFYDKFIIPNALYTETSGIFLYLEEKLSATVKRFREVLVLSLLSSTLFCILYKLVIQHLVFLAGYITRVAIPVPGIFESIVYVVIGVISVLFNYLFISVLDAIFIYNMSVLKTTSFSAKSKGLVGKHYYINQLSLLYKKNPSLFLRKHPEIVNDLFAYFSKEFSKFAALISEMSSKCQLYTSNKHAGLFRTNRVVTHKDGAQIEVLTLWESIKLRYDIFVLTRKYAYGYASILKILNLMVCIKDRECMDAILNKHAEELRASIRKVPIINGYKVVNMDYKAAVEIIQKLLLS